MQKQTEIQENILYIIANIINCFLYAKYILNTWNISFNPHTNIMT